MRYNEGDHSLHVHQSDIKNWLNCGHQVFLKSRMADGEHFETDAATIGTCLHATIEEELENGFFMDEDTACLWAAQFFVDTLQEYHNTGAVYSRSSYDNEGKALKVLDRVVRTWYRSDERSYLASRDDKLVEWDFDVPLGINLGGMDLYVSGQADLVLPGTAVWDWKTASQAYKRWEKQRWDPQPTVYTYAAQYEGLLKPDKWGEYEFYYKVFDTKGTTPGPPESVPVKRSPNNWDWLKAVVVNMVKIKEGLPDGPWPMNDAHVLCSPKWCPVWDKCKGAVVDGERWT